MEEYIQMLKSSRGAEFISTKEIDKLSDAPTVRTNALSLEVTADWEGGQGFVS